MDVYEHVFKICACNWHLFMNRQGGTWGVLDLPCLNVVVDGSVQLFLRGQVVSPMLLQFHNFCREGIASQVHSWAMIKFMKFLNSDRQLPVNHFWLEWNRFEKK